MSRLKSIVLMLVSGGALLGAGELKLIPYPRSVTAQGGELNLPAPVRIRVASAQAEDRFAASLLAEDLKSIAGAASTSGASPGGGPGIVLGRAGTPEIDAEIARRKLDAAALERPESYLLDAGAGGVLVAARSAQGVYYGVQTLRQLVAPGSGKDGIRIPQVRISDWPALRSRGFSLDLSRGPIITEETMQTVIRTLGEFKMNVLSFYMEHVYEYAHAPGVTREGGAVTPELMKRMIAYGRRHHVELIPQQQTFGHLHHLLKFERYAPMAEVPFGHVLAPADERGYEWIHKAIAQLASDFQSRYVHIGSDETRDLGMGRSREYAEKMGVGNVYMEHMQKVYERARPLGKKLMFWGDIALSHPELISQLPRELVAMTWDYEPREDFTRWIEPFGKLGMEVWVCPSVNNYNKVFPHISASVVNINNFVRDGKRLGAVGMLNTHWGDDGESQWNVCWYGLVFSAAASWQEGSVDAAAFRRAFDWSFHRNPGSDFADAIHKLDRIHELARGAGERAAMDELSWFDPFTRLGAGRVNRLAPAASEMRLLAEDVEIAMRKNAGKARHHREAIPYLIFAAKRLDSIGMRIQLSKAIGEGYRSGQIGRVSGANGFAQDLRDYANELKGMYRALWLAESRPYWLDNTLMRFDHEALYWIHKGLLFGSLNQQYRLDKRLPEPESVGLVLP